MRNINSILHFANQHTANFSRWCIDFYDRMGPLSPPYIVEYIGFNTIRRKRMNTAGVRITNLAYQAIDDKYPR